MTSWHKGQASVEFALVTIILVSGFFVVVDLSGMIFANLAMQHAVREGARYAVTGRTERNMDRRTAVIRKIRTSSYGLYDSNLQVNKEPTFSVVQPARVSFDNYSGTPASGEPGGPNEIIVIRLTYTWQLITPALTLIFPNGHYTFTVSSTMKNEPWPTAGT